MFKVEAIPLEDGEETLETVLNEAEPLCACNLRRFGRLRFLDSFDFLAVRGLGERGFSLLLFLLRPVVVERLSRMLVRSSDVSKVSEIGRKVSLVGSAMGGMDEQEDERSLGVLLRLVACSTNEMLAGESTSFSSPSSADSSGGSAKRAQSSGG